MSNSKTVAIVGAGIVGMLAAENFFSRGWQVVVFEKEKREYSAHCSRTAAGMIAPCSELEVAEGLIGRLGNLSLSLWDELMEKWALDVSYKRKGSIILTHPRDMEELYRFKKRVNYFDRSIGSFVDYEGLREYEPNLPPVFQKGLFLKEEGQIDGIGFLRVLSEKLAEKGVAFHYECEVDEVLPNILRIGSQEESFSWVIDCRGLGGRKDLKELRGVRGEIIKVYTEEVNFSRPIRLLHPRFPIYIVPQEDNHYLIGATLIESESNLSITVRSALELLSSAHCVHPGFSEANIVETSVGLRPAFFDNLPKIICESGKISVNGLYRHGFLLSPILSKWVVDYCENKKIPFYQSIFQELTCKL